MSILQLIAKSKALMLAHARGGNPWRTEGGQWGSRDTDADGQPYSHPLSDEDKKAIRLQIWDFMLDNADEVKAAIGPFPFEEELLGYLLQPKVFPRLRLKDRDAKAFQALTREEQRAVVTRLVEKVQKGELSNPGIVQLVKAWQGNPWKGKDSKFSTKESDEDSIPYTSPKPVEAKRGHFGTKVKPGWKKITYVDSDVTYYYDKEKKSWMWSDTKKPVDEDTARRLKESGAPPGWRRVQLNADPNGKMAVLGYAVKEDGTEKRQMRRSAAAEEKADLTKWARLKDFMSALPSIRKQVQKDLSSSDDRTKELAEILYLIDKTAFRISSDKDTGGEEEAYGATTLLARFITIDGDSVRFQFQQKGGKDMDKTVEDKTLARIMSKRIKGVGKNDPIFSATDKQVRAYLKKVAKVDVKVHDYRAYHATAIAMREIKKYEYPAPDDKTLKKIQKEVSAVAAEMLGNTPKMALDSYIAPQVWNVFKKEG